jgi:ATP-binding cassette, subfamily B, bacterial HlyB/CyaB
MAEDSNEKPDFCLVSLALFLRFHGVAAEPEQIRLQSGGAVVGITEILRYARSPGLKARVVSSAADLCGHIPIEQTGIKTEQGFCQAGGRHNRDRGNQDGSVPRERILAVTVAALSA